MMYTNNFVACIKVNGRILRENNDQVRIPFGSEYSVLIKNLNSVQGLFKLSIDGKNTSDVGEGKIIIGANQEVEIERYIAGGNYNEGNRFKFIERTAAVERHRGVGAEDGLVRVEFWKELVQTYTPLYPSTYPYDRRRRNDPWRPRDRRNPFSPGNRRATWSSSSPIRSHGICGQSMNTSYASNLSKSCVETATPTSGSFIQSFNSVSDVGVTAPGSISNQQFTTGSWFPVETTSHVIVLHLLGEIRGKQVKVAATVNQKRNCVSCGKVNKNNASFCSSCGTSLELVY